MKNKQKARRRCAWISAVLLCIVAILPVLFLPASAEIQSGLPTIPDNPGWVTPSDSCSADLSGSSCTYIGSLKFEDFTLPTHYQDITTQYAKQTYSNFVLRYYEGSAWKYVFVDDADIYLSVDASSSGTHFKIFVYGYGSVSIGKYSLVLSYDAGDEGFRVGSDTHLIRSFEIYGIYGNSDAWAEFSQVLQSVGGSSDKLEETDSTYEAGYNAGYTAGARDGQAAGYQSGYEAGKAESGNYDKGFEAGKKAGKVEGEALHAMDYQNGFEAGKTYAMNSTSSLKDLIFSIFSAPADLINGILDFDLFGINLASLVKTLITLTVTALIVVFLIKLMKR